MTRQRVDILNPNLVVFVSELQKLINEGYYVCEEDVPSMMGWNYQAVLYKDEDKKTLGRPIKNNKGE